MDIEHRDLLAKLNKKLKDIEKIKAEIFQMGQFYFLDDIKEALRQVVQERDNEARIREYEKEFQAMTITQLEDCVKDFDEAVVQMGLSPDKQHIEYRTKFTDRIAELEKGA